MPLTATTVAASAVSTKQMVVVITTNAAALGQFLAVFAVTQIDPTSKVWSPSEVLAYILSGSLGGAFLKVYLIPPKIDHMSPTLASSKLAFEYLACGICGIIFTPAILYYLKIEPSAIVIMAASGIVAFLGTLTLTTLGQNWKAVCQSVIEYVKKKFLPKNF